MLPDHGLVVFIFWVEMDIIVLSLQWLRCVNYWSETVSGGLMRTVMPSLQGRQVVLAAVTVKQKSEPEVVLMEHGCSTT